jgi:hypothetical protein
MSNLSDLPPLLAVSAQMLQGRVQGVSDAGWIEVRAAGLETAIRCRVLCVPGSTSALAAGDEVLVWMSGEETGGSIVLGRVGLQSDAVVPVVPADEFAERPKSVIIEAQGDLVLRNGHARIKLGAEGDIEIVCASFVTRSQRLLRLLAPFIRLN